VTQIAISPGFANEPLEDVSDNDEKVWGEGVALSKAVTATDPVSGDTIKKDSGVPSRENLRHPIAPLFIETPSFKDEEEAPPMDRVERLLEVQFEDNGRSFPDVAAAEEVSRVDDVFRNATPRKETSLVSVHQGVDSGLEPSSEDFGNSFHDTILQRDWTEEGGVIGGIRFREENEKGSVDLGKVNIPSKEGVKNRKDIISEKVPKGHEESRTKAVWPRAGNLVHIAKGIADLIPGKRGTEAAMERGGVWIQVR
jgi:hypothetical protein